MKKRYKHYIIIIITVLILTLFTTRFGNVFGSDTDWINQHTVIPDYFRQMFYQTGKLLPNFALNYGGGQNIFNLSYYGLLNPIVLVSYIFPFFSMQLFMTITNIIIIITTIIIFYKWLINHGYNENICLLTSLIFLLAAPFVFQMHRHIMFVNYMPFLVLSLIGVDKFLKNGDSKCLIINIFLMIMVSYYYSVCGILVVGIYYLYQYFKINEKIVVKEFLLNLGKFIIRIIVAVLLSSILLLPTLYALLSGRGSASSAIDLVDLFIPYLKIHKIFCGTYAIGLSMIGFISLLYLFYTKKKYNVIVATLMSIVLFIPVFRYLLNGGLYLREKCFIPFLPLLSFFIAYFINDLYNKKINIKKFLIYLLIILLPLYYYNQKEVCFILLIPFLILVFIADKFKKNWLISLYLIVFFSCTFIYESSLEEFVSVNDYNKYFSGETEKNIDNTINNDKEFYRTENLMYDTKTVNKIYDKRYYSTNIYSSTYNNYYLEFVRNIFKNSMIEYNYFMISTSNNLLFNTFMGVKYLNSLYDPGIGYEKISDNIYKNDNSFPLIYGTNHLLNEKEFDNYSYPSTMELLLKNAVIKGDSHNSFVESKIEEVNLKYSLIKSDGVQIAKNKDGYILDVLEEGNIVIELKNSLINKLLLINLEGLEANSCSIDNIAITINNITNVLTCRSWIYNNKNNDFHYVISEKDLKTLTIHLNKGKYNINQIKTYIMNYDDIDDAKKNLIEFDVQNISTDKITGRINLENNGYLVTSIPYDNGFSVYVDGKPTKYEMVNKAFLGLPLSKGEHEIVITYASPWLKEGKIGTCFGIISLIVIIYYDSKKRSR